MTSPVSGVGASPAAVGVTVPNTLGVSTDPSKSLTLSSDSFLQLLVAQLKYQDPSKPVDTSSFMQETATLSQVQSMEANQKAAAQSLAAQQTMAATNLVGRTVKYTAMDGSTAQGVVTSAVLTGTSPTLNIGGSSIALANVTEVLSS